MTCLVIGLTSISDPTCKRGVAANPGASIARTRPELRAAVIGVEPAERNGRKRRHVRRPLVEHFMRDRTPEASAIGFHPTRSLAVVPNGGQQQRLVCEAAVVACSTLAQHFDVLVCDLPATEASGQIVFEALAPVLERLIVAVTPMRPAV